MGTLLLPFASFAHADETTITVLSLSATPSILDASTYLHPIQVERLLRTKYGKAWSGTPDFFRYQGELFTYLEQHLALKNNQKDCSFFAKDIPLRDELTLVADGLQLNYHWICSEPVHQLMVKNRLFLDETPDQENQVEIHLSTDTPSLYQRRFTKLHSEQEIKIEIPINNPPINSVEVHSSTGLFRRLVQRLWSFLTSRLGNLLPQRKIDLPID